MDALFTLAPVVWPVEGRAQGFPVRRVFCVGRNYADHVAEMGGNAARSTPVIFTKDAACLVHPGEPARYPADTSDLHHEVELVVAVGPGGGVWGHAVGIDLTRRDLQAAAKAKGGPWDRAKSFPDSAPMGVLREGPVEPGAKVSLHVDGELRQSSPLDRMIWSVEEVLDHLRADMGLAAGDLVFTGTPAGVGPVVTGETMRAEVTGLPVLEVRVV